MTYDRVDWHNGDNFPEGLPPENGGTHIGMFLAWCIINKLSGEFHDEESASALTAVRARTMTGREFLESMCDSKFWDEDLNEDGNSFARSYYQNPDGKGYGPYIEDYETLLSSRYLSTYYVEDTWENYDRIANRISERYNNFRAGFSNK